MAYDDDDPNLFANRLAFNGWDDSGRQARERMQRPDLKLTVAELMLWLHDQPGHATIRLNVRGQVALCEGHTLGHIDNEPVIILTGEEDPT